MHVRPTPLRLLVAVTLLLTSGPAWSAIASPLAGPDLAIRVLSNRADLISAGDALVQVDLPRGQAKARVTVDGRDVSQSFASRANGRYQGLLTGLRVGANSVVARAGSQVARTTITNHPNGGPVFS